MKKNRIIAPLIEGIGEFLIILSATIFSIRLFILQMKGNESFPWLFIIVAILGVIAKIYSKYYLDEVYKA